MIKEDKKIKGKFKGRKKEKSEYEQKVIDIARVTRVVKGGKRFSFRTTMVIGNKRGKVGVGIAKGSDMKISTEKSYANARKNLVEVKIKGNTIPYPISYKLGGAKIILKPSSRGKGIVAGGAVRTVMNLAGISDVSGKMLGSSSKISNARAAIEALKQFSIKKVKEIEIEEKKRKEKNDLESKAREKNEKKTEKSKKEK